MSDVSVAVVAAFERISDENGVRVEVKVDQADQTLMTVIDAPPCNFDCPPLPGDFAAIKEAPGGSSQAIGYLDSKNAGKALGGETRIIARAPDGTVVFELWAHADTKMLDVQGIAPGWTYRFGKLTIDEDGNVTTPGDLTVKSGGPSSVTLSTHLHPTGTGPSGAPTPGT